MNSFFYRNLATRPSNLRPFWTHQFHLVFFCHSALALLVKTWTICGLSFAMDYSILLADMSSWNCLPAFSTFPLALYVSTYGCSLRASTYRVVPLPRFEQCFSYTLFILPRSFTFLPLTTFRLPIP